MIKKKWFDTVMDWRIWVFPLLLSVLLVIVAKVDFLTFHTLVELFTIIISFIMFAFVWYSHDFSKNLILLFLACGYFWIGSLDLLHVIVYKGMNLFYSDNGNASTQIWITTRYAESLLLLTAPLLSYRVRSKNILVLAFGVIAFSIVILIFSGYFPVTYIENTGLTPFKIYSEYIIILILLLSLITLFRFGEGILEVEKELIALSIVMTICAEIAFTSYVSLYGSANMAGHIFKLFSFWFIFQAIIISNLRKPHIALVESEAYLRNALKDLKNQRYLLDQHALVLTTDQFGNIIYVNDKFCKTSGYTREEIMGQNPRLFKSSFHPDTFYKEMWNVISGGNIWHGEICNQAKNGAHHWLDSTIAPIYDDHGNINQYITIRTDITERKIAEEATRKSETRFREIAETINEVFFIIAPDFKEMIYLSPAFKKIFGLPTKNSSEIPKTVEEYLKKWVHPDDWHILESAVELRVKGDFSTKIPDYRIIQKDSGIRWISTETHPVRNKQGEIIHIIGNHQDVTERRRLGRELRQSQKMEAVGQLTGGIAHDFNNILGIIRGNLEILKIIMPKDAESLERADKAIAGVERGAKIIKKLLNFSRHKVYATELILINHSIDNLKELIARSLTAAIIVKTTLAKKLWRVSIEPDELENAILNLALNARNAMPNGGTLLIGTENKILDKTYVSQNPSSKEGEYVMVSVSDTGCGMSLETQDKILEPFYTTKENEEGTGLGLSMVHGFIRRSGGHINIYSELGKGTTIRLYIPKSLTDVKQTSDIEPDQMTMVQGHETILIVDDEPALCEVAKTQLDILGYTIIIANNAREALSILQKNQNIDLLFSDIVMPGHMDGYELAREVLKKYPDVKILLTSGFTQNREIHLNNGNRKLSRLAQNLLSKPYSQVELANAIRNILDSEYS